MNQIVVKNAKAHNLKDVSVTIPGNKLVGFVGKSADLNGPRRPGRNAGCNARRGSFVQDGGDGIGLSVSAFVRLFGRTLNGSDIDDRAFGYFRDGGSVGLIGRRVTLSRRNRT